MTNRSVTFWLSMGLGFLVFLYLIRSILLPFVAGPLVAYFLSPLVDRLVHRRLPRAAATMLVLGGFFAILTLVGVLVVPVLAEQLVSLLQGLPEYIAGLQKTYSPLLSRYVGKVPALDGKQLPASLSEYSGTALEVAGHIAASLLASSLALINVISLVLITPVVAFYLMNDWHRIIAHLDTLLPRRHAPIIREQIGIIDRTLAGFVRGQVNVCLLLGSYYAIGLSIAGLKFGAVIGLMTGLLVIVPYVGFFFGFSVGMLIALYQFGDSHAVLVVAGVFLTGMVLEGNIITPKLVGEKVGLHPVWIIFGLLAGAALFGFVGVLLAVPVSAVIGVLTRFAVSQYLHSRYYENTPPPQGTR